MTQGWKTFFAMTLLGFVALLGWDIGQWLDSGDGVQLVVWDQPAAGRQNARAVWMEAVDEFENSYPDIRVKPIARKYIQQQFITVMASGKGPDVVQVPVSALPTLARHGFLAPLDKEIKTWDFENLVPNLLWEPARVDGHTYGVPYDSYFMTLLIRKDLYLAAGLDPNHPPATWDALTRAAVKMTDLSRDQYGFGFSPTTEQFMDFVWQAGGDLVQWDGQQWRATFARNAGITALTYLRDLRFEKGVMQPNPLASNDELAQLFALGQLGMMLGVANQMPDLISRYGMRNQDLLIAPLPAGPTGIKASHSGGGYFVVNAHSDAPTQKAAWAYIETVLSPPNQLAKWAMMKRRHMPVYPGIFSITANLHNNPKFRLIKEALGYARVEPHPQNWPLLRDQLDSMVLQKVFLDADADVEQTLIDAAYDMDERFF